MNFKTLQMISSLLTAEYNKAKAAYDAMNAEYNTASGEADTSEAVLMALKEKRDETYKEFIAIQNASQEFHSKSWN